MVPRVMHHFQCQKDELYCEEVPVSEIARNVGTPFYLYSHATLIQHFRAFDGAFGDLKHLTCFSMKSNSNLAILKLLAGEGGGVLARTRDPSRLDIDARGLLTIRCAAHNTEKGGKTDAPL